MLLHGRLTADGLVHVATAEFSTRAKNFSVALLLRLFRPVFLGQAAAGLADPAKPARSWPAGERLYVWPCMPCQAQAAVNFFKGSKGTKRHAAHLINLSQNKALAVKSKPSRAGRLDWIQRAAVARSC